MDLLKNRTPQPSDLLWFLRTFAIDPSQWVGGITGKTGLFFTPHPIPQAVAHHYRWPVKESSFRAPEVTEIVGGFTTLYVETDVLSLEEQAERLLRLPQPTAVVHTGDPRYSSHRGKSLHAFWRLYEAVTFEQWLTLQRGLLGFMLGDPCTLSPIQAMRVGGVHHSGRVQTLLHLGGWIRAEVIASAVAGSVETGRILQAAPLAGRSDDLDDEGKPIAYVHRPHPLSENFSLCGLMAASIAIAGREGNAPATEGPCELCAKLSASVFPPA